MLNWRQKHRVFRTAWLLRYEAEIAPDAIQPSERVQTGGRGGGRALLEWAVDFLSCGDAKILAPLYTEGQVGAPVPKGLRKPHREFWREVGRRRLENTGLRIAALVYGTTGQGDTGDGK